MGVMADSFRRAVAAAKEGETDFTVTLEGRRDSSRWIQLRGDTINAAYPLQGEPVAELLERGFTLPEGVELVAWEPGRFATFGHGGEPLAELVGFVERYSREVLGVEPSESTFAVSTEA